MQQIFCPTGGIPDATRPCGVDGCSEEVCCRPAMNCGETTYVYLCPAGTYPLLSQPCSGAGCNETTCCAKATTCDEANANLLMCSFAGMESIGPGVACTGNCTVSQCCKAPTSCGVIIDCPAGSRNQGGPCQGAQCSQSYCCVPSQDCSAAFEGNISFCDGFGFRVMTVGNTGCQGPCTQAQCCRPARSCGEVAKETRKRKKVFGVHENVDL